MLLTRSSCKCNAAKTSTGFVNVDGRRRQLPWIRYDIASGTRTQATWMSRQNRGTWGTNPSNRRRKLIQMKNVDGEGECVDSSLGLPSSSSSSSSMVSDHYSQHVYPKPKVWTLSRKTGTSDLGSLLELNWDEVTLDSGKLTTNSQTPSLQVVPAIETWNWCKHFVVPLKLCPWARASLETPLALQLFMVSETDIRNVGSNPSRSDSCEDIIRNVAVKFQQLIQSRPSLASHAIFFVVFVPSSTSGENEQSNDDGSGDWFMNSFAGFYDWFIELEDWWTLNDENDPITIAPFHPLWEFGCDDDTVDDTGEADDTDKEWEQLAYEKKSPYPTVTIVSSATIDQAGPIVTEQIAETNLDTLTSFSVDQLDEIWNEGVYKR